MGEMIDVTVGDTAMAAYVARPAAPAAQDGSAVVVLMEAFGVNDHIRSICDRFAARGSVAIAPDLYHRQGRLITGEYTDAGAVMPYFATLDAESMAADIDAAIGAVTGRTGDDATGDDAAGDDAAGVDAAGVDAARVGVIGFCLGGYGAVLAACRSTPAVAAGFYGAGLAIRRIGSPLVTLSSEFDEIECPVLLFYGADDAVIPPEEIAAVRAALEERGIEHEIQVYDGAGHGFFCDERASYRPDAAADAWQRVELAFDRALGRAGQP